MRNKFLAAFLALSCGILDKFYLGRSAAGWIRIGLCFIFPIIPFLALVGFVEALRLFGMSQREFDRKYNKDELAFHSRNQSQRGPADTPRVRVRGKGTQYRHADRRSGGAEDRPMPKPDSSNPFKISGRQKYRDYDYEGAIHDFQEALSIEPRDIATHFNIACAYSLTEQTQKAITHLDKAIRLGFKDFKKIDQKEAFAFIRVTPEFEEFVKNGYQLSQPTTENEKAERLKPGLEAPRPNLLDEDAAKLQLEKITQLKNKGVLTEEEYLEYKRRLMK
jgi:tetratricopeptide (TPR) repeat protein